MNESAILQQTRKYSLWAALVSAAGLLLLVLLVIWGVIDFMEEPDFFSGFGIEITPWGKLIATFYVALSVATSVLLALLVASHVRKPE